MSACKRLFMMIAGVVLAASAAVSPVQAAEPAGKGAPGIAPNKQKDDWDKDAKTAKSEPGKEQKGGAKEEDGGFGKGPVDRKVHISGVFATSGRFTWLDRHNIADGSRVEDDHTFEIEHTHLKFSGDITNKLSWTILPCVTHGNDFNVIEVKLSYAFHSAFQVTAGRFLLPFGRFNLRSFPGMYPTASRPLLFRSHEDRFLSYPGTPLNFIFTPREDIGVQLAGSVWIGEAEEVQLSYTAYVTNGLRGVSDTMARFWDDNNSGKQVGGRVTLGYFHGPFSFSVGASGLLNKWEKDLNQMAVGGDASLSYEVAPGRRINLTGEYVFTRREVKPGPELLQGDEERSGFYITVDGKVLSWLGLFAQYDSLTNVTPRALLNEGFRDDSVTINRWLGGLLFTPAGSLAIRLEYSHWLMPLGYPDADRVVVQALVTF